MPRYDRYEKLRSDIGASVKGGAIDVRWAKNGQFFTYRDTDGKNLRYDIGSKKATDAADVKEDDLVAPGPGANLGGRRRAPVQGNRAQPARGRQFDIVYSPEGDLKAYFKDRNVWISSKDNTGEYAVTTTGSAAKRTKCGQASWVYGEELGVREAMWWSPDGKKLAYYLFDESKVPDYYLGMEQTQIQDKLDTEAYPKAGVDNPAVQLFVYDLGSKKTTEVDSKFGDPSLGEYVYDVRWSEDGKEILFNRTNRHQNHLQFVAANPETGTCRAVVDEDWSKAWNDNHPPIIWLKADEGKPRRFLWLSERNGFRNIYLGDMSGATLKPVTSYGSFEVQNVVKVDEDRGLVFFMARDGDTPYKLQLHRIKLDGSGDKRLTDPHLSHSVEIAPDDSHFIDIAQDLDSPPTTRLCDADGRTVDTLATADTSKFDSMGLKKAEQLKFKAADGKTDLYGILFFPSDFDPNKKYPLLVSVYGGPESGTGVERFRTPDPITEMGFLVAWFDGRGTSGRGKAFADAVYKHLGIVEMDDQAAGVKYLAQRPYVDGKRVGIFGTSYGGYSSVMCLLRHPEAFQVAVASSPVTDWRNYDSIYTERYMGLPTDDDNKTGYEAGSAMTYAKDLKGRLMIFYGTADNNVHPSNTMQLVQALQTARKSFDLMVGPDKGHSGIDQTRMWEYFVDYLILDRDKQPMKLAWNARRKRLALRTATS